MENQTQTELKSVSIKDLKSLLTANDYELFRRGVVMRCMITNATWSHWTTGKYNPETKYQPIIDAVAAQFGLTIFGTEGGQQ